MTNDVSTTLPPALSRALDLLVDPPAEPDVNNGYLDLLGTTADGDVAKNNGAIQAAWASTIGSFVYDNPRRWPGGSSPHGSCRSTGWTSRKAVSSWTSARAPDPSR